MKLVATPEAEDDPVIAGGFNFALMMQTLSAPFIGRTLNVACEMGIFELLADGPLTIDQIVEAGALGRRAAFGLLEALSTTPYVVHDGSGSYSLAPFARDALVGRGRGGFADVLCFGRLEMEWAHRLDDFVERGTIVDIHARMTPSDWETYKRAQWAASLAGRSTLAELLTSDQTIRRALDVGGAHAPLLLHLGASRPDLAMAVADWPEGRRALETLTSKSEGRERLSLRATDPRTADFGEGEYDVVVSSGVLQHLAREDARAFVMRCARAVRRGGTLALIDFIPPKDDARQQTSLYALFFAMLSPGGPWTSADVEGWLREGAIEPPRSVELLPGTVWAVYGKKRPE